MLYRDASSSMSEENSYILKIKKWRMADFLKIEKSTISQKVLTKFNLMDCHYFDNEKSPYTLINILIENVL